METLYDVLAVIGGAGVVVIGLSAFLARVWEKRIERRERRQIDATAERERQEYGVRRVQADLSARNQFDVYLKLWGELQALKLTVDALWEEVTDGNLLRLTEQLRSAQHQVDSWCLFIEPDHLARLRRAFDMIGNYSAGKFALRDLYKHNIASANKSKIHQQIHRNAHDRREFEDALEALSLSFQSRMSRVTPDTGGLTPHSS